MKKPFLLILNAAVFLLSGATPARADGLSSFENIDSLIEDNALTETANRYNALLLSYRPEEASRLGYTSANELINQRTPAVQSAAAAALEVVKESLDAINVKKLSRAKQADYDILKSRLEADLQFLQTNPVKTNPLYHAQALDAVYDLQAKRLTDKGNQGKALHSRIKAVGNTAKQARENITKSSALGAQLAMEKAYYAYLAFDEMSADLQQNTEDDVSRAQIAADSNAAKKQIKDLFEFFKALSKETDTEDFRLGAAAYTQRLQNVYFTPSKKLDKTLQTNFQNALGTLQRKLEPFMTHLDGTEMLVEGQETPAAQPRKMTKKERKAFLESLTARDFYTVSARLPKQTPPQNALPENMAQEVLSLSQFFAQDGSLPRFSPQVAVREMPAYHAYTRAYLFMPPFGLQNNPSYDFFVRLPSGNRLNKQEMAEKDFNLPVRKLMLAGELIPGRYFQAAYAGIYPTPRALLPVPTTQNGWSVYAQHLAAERGYIASDEEKLYLAWADFVRAAAALTDYRLHTKEWSYAQALEFLTRQTGLEQTEAEEIIKSSAALPGEAVSYITGYQAIDAVRKKYQKKLGKKFSLADFHAKLLKLGAIPPNRLDEEIKNAYADEKKKDKQSDALYM